MYLGIVYIKVHSKNYVSKPKRLIYQGFWILDVSDSDSLKKNMADDLY